MKKGVISIIIPVYNSEKYIELCLKSVINQTYNNLEIIIINDGSTDDSYEICKKISNNDTRIKIINQENMGVSEARNAGLKIANGEFIYFMDSDDWIEQNMFYNMIKLNIDYTNSIIICGCVEDYYEYDKLVEQKKYYIKNENIKIDQLKKNICTYMNLIRPELWNKIFHWSVIKGTKFDSSLKLGEDLEFFTRTLKNVKEIYINNKCPYHFRINNKINKLYHNTDFEDEVIREKKIKMNLYNCNIDLNQIDRYIARRSYLIAYTSCYYIKRNINEKDIMKIKINNIIENEFLKKYNRYIAYGEYMRSQIIMKFFVKFQLKKICRIYFSVLVKKRK